MSLEDLAQHSSAFDGAVGRTPAVDRFCSASDWILPAAHHLMPKRESWIHSADDHFCAFMRAEHPDGTAYLEPLEHMWALASPLIGPDVETLIEGVATLCQAPIDDWAMMALSGIAPGSGVFDTLIETFAERYRLGLGPTMTRFVALLDDGADAFLERRSKQFRRSLFRSGRAAGAAGIVIVDASTQEPEALYRRLQDVESRAWKGKQGVGITDGVMHDFYQEMLPRLHARQALRLLFAQDEGRDVAFIFGGIRGREYRGLQFSFDEKYRKFGLGNVLQWDQIRRLCQESILVYDLGTPMAYKEHWADETRESVTLLLVR